MATTYTNDIQKLYVAYFNRPADPKGLAYWEGVVEAAKGDTSAVSADFAASTEYQDTYKGMSNADVVNAVYNNLFGHDADSAGQKYWADLLDSKSLTVDAVVTAIAGGAQGTDMTAYNDKVIAASAFTAALDTDAEVAGYAGDANAAAKTWLSGVTDANSLAAAVDQANLNTTVAEVVAKGTPFTVAGALAQLDAANKAVDDFATGLKSDVNKDGTVDTADIDAALSKAVAKVAGELDTSSTLFSDPTTSTSVRDALVAAQQAINSAQLSKDQVTLTADNTNIAKVAGLSSAAATLTAAAAADDAAHAAEAATAADLAAKKASFDSTNKGTVDISGTSLVLTGTDGSLTTLGDVASNGKVTLHSGVTASNYTGLTDLIASYSNEAAAANSVTKADLNLANAQLAVSLLDVAPDSTGVVHYIDGSGADITTSYATESALIAAIAQQINTTTPDTVATGATPTVSQIQTELAVLHAKADQTDYTNFKAMVDTETNGMSAAQAAATVALNSATDTLATDTLASNTALNTYNSDVSAFKIAHATAGTLSVSSTAMTLTAADGTVTTVATVDSTAHTATETADGTALGYSELDTAITAYNDYLGKAATVTTDKGNVTTAQGTLDAAVTLNPLTATLTADTAKVAADQKAISTLATDVTALHTAEANSDMLKGLQATVTADEKVLSDAGYNVVNLTTDAGMEFGTAKSDVYVVHGSSETIGAFGLQGTDSVFVGTGYTLVQGAIGDKGVADDNSAMQIFVSNNDAGDAQLQIETHAYSSAVASTAGEIVTITLTGVDAASLHLDNNGIISSTPAAA